RYHTHQYSGPTAFFAMMGGCPRRAGRDATTSIRTDPAILSHILRELPMPHPLIRPPIVQVAIDVLNIDDALRIAEAAVRAGADWLEIGTPLVTFEGTRAIEAIAKAFPQATVLCDYKMMDGTRKYVLETKARGGHLATVCAVASDASIRTAVAAGKETGIAI